MSPLKHLVAILALGTALIAAPAVVDAHVALHKPVAKHVTKKPVHKVHRKHVRKHVTKRTPSKLHKAVSTKAAPGKKPLAAKKVAPAKTTAGWHHHAQTI